MACAITVPPEYLSAYSVLYELVHALSMSIPPTPLMVTAGGLPDLANLTLREVEPLTNAVACLSEENIATPASKRKSVSTSTDPSSTSSTASNIVRHDSGQLSVRLILLSRLLDVRNHEKLMTLSNTGIGGALLAMLRDIFLQAARAIGGTLHRHLPPLMSKASSTRQGVCSSAHQCMLHSSVFRGGCHLLPRPSCTKSC